jgi:hypothetical protein
LPADDRQSQAGHFKASPTGPSVAPPRISPRPLSPPPRSVIGWRRGPIWSLVFFVLLVCGVGIRAYRDLSQPEAWAYWKESYFAPSMTSSFISKVDVDSSGHGRATLAIRGMIGAASASWLRDRLEESRLAAGDLVLLSSPGGNVEQALIMGEIIRSHGLSTAVGTIDASGRITRSSCASACVLIYAGGMVRYGIEGSRLGVHRFVASLPARDPIAEAQRTTGTILSYVTKMGISSSVVEAMSQTWEIRWLDPAEALAMHLVTEPIRAAESARH